MNGKPERGDVLWSWVIKAVSLGVFVHSTIIADEKNFLIAFLAICGASFPAREFRGILRSWRGRTGE